MAPEVLRIVQYKKPVPKDDEVLINICATSVTNSDISSVAQDFSTISHPDENHDCIRKPRKDIIGEVFSGVITGIVRKLLAFMLAIRSMD